MTIHKPQAFIVDVDGTLALRTGASPRDPYDMTRVREDTPNWPVLSLLDALQRFWPRAKTIVVSAREDQEFNETSTLAATAAWLQEYRIHYDEIYLRRTRDYRPDHIIKRELYWEHVAHRYDVLYVLDDRNSARAPVVDMWRKLGLTCLQVAEGDF